MGRIFATSWVPSGFFQSILSASILLCSIGSSATQASSPPCYPAIFSLGDSLSDTGNGALTGNLLFRRPTMPPYGETFPGRPSARFSDGRLLVDFLAAFVGLPSLNPSLNTNADLSRGVNYAVSGATALNATFLASKLVFPLSRLSLEVQLSWHLALKASVDAAGGSAQGIPSSTSFSGGLYVILIGGNDYIGAFQSDYSPSAVIATFVPLVIDKIRSVTEELFASGARSFLFISITPLGCSPSVLARYPSTLKDSAGCLEDYNSVAKAHGAELLALVRSLRAAHASGTFMFADYYGAYEFVLENSAARGFRETLNTCCGAAPPTPYGYNVVIFCNRLSGSVPSTVLCSDPDAFLNWDGIHFTDRFNSQIANLTFSTGTYLDPSNGLVACV